MKKILFLVAIIPLLMLVSCAPPAVVQGDAHPTTFETRAFGDVFEARITLPEGETVETVIWTSSDEAIAVVENGLVMVELPGTVEITATKADGEVIQTLALTVPASCNFDLPGFGPSIGTVSFATNQKWTVGSLTWSDAVQTSVCSNRTTYHGGYWGAQNFNADCRSNPGQTGDLFTWCAVIRFQDELCPYPWRVPTREDFFALDREFGGNAENREDINALNLYLSNWGGTFSGYCSPSGVRGVQGAWAFYWASTLRGPTTGHLLALSAEGFVGPNRDSVKYRGFALRCVRDAQ